MNYRNKTIFDWKDYKRNVVSSVLSLDFVRSLDISFVATCRDRAPIRNCGIVVSTLFQYH